MHHFLRIYGSNGDLKGFCAPLLIPNQILPEKTKDLFLQKQLMKLMRLRANQRQSTLYNVQEGSGHGGDIDYIYIIGISQGPY